MGRGLLYRKNSSSQGGLTVEGYADADWAGFPFDRRSTSGYCTFVGSHLVTWKSKKQSVVARSSAEAEYRAMALVAQQLIWIKILLSEMGFPITRPMELHCNNKAAIYISTNPVFHERTKHIEIDCHFIRERVLSKEIHLAYTKSSDQIADILTKSLSQHQHDSLCSKLCCIILCRLTNLLKLTNPVRLVNWLKSNRPDPPR